ncbi:TonB-dependent receptor [Marinagarivorans cellulosilyticus]|uniref:TonB-dependent receptor n=1 Tax=Marinagarivorans cellulosilyticus TaxID=2721545 RepID=A0AAN2BIK4_9GAMM|nr:TonB-dependent receptor [Marinagarivorans cellulosilyticus]BCD96090.1 hypothetical protein MARGE09_P0289 [Marinagarivorans cellulosilyticus]
MPLRKSQTLAFVISSLAVYGLPAIAQDAPALEEVLVTATKREQSLQEIPLSVAAVTGEKLNDTGTKTLADLTTLVPNIHFTQTGLSTQMRIRGIGSDNSQGFEQSVGVYSDGIFRGRAQLFRAPMFDMERVEVMRGPQSTLFGKNSIAGALDLITAKPTEELTGYLTGSYETEFGAKELTTVVSGPLTDTLRGRIALRKLDDPGYFENTFKGTDEPEQDVTSGRISLEWEPNDQTRILYIGEKSEFDTLGRPIEITKDSPSVIPPSTPGLGVFNGFTYQQILPALGQPTFDAQQDYKRQTNDAEFSENNTSSHTLQMEWDVNGYTITSLTGGVGYDYKENCDCDFTAANIFNLGMEEDYSQYSQEIRIASPLGKTFDWIGGVFFQSYNQNFSDLLRVPGNSTESAENSILPGLVAGATPLAAYEKQYQASLEAGRDEALARMDAQSAADQVTALIPVTTAEFANTGVQRNFEQDSRAQAIFGQVTWNINTDFRMILGGRYTSETKKGQKAVQIMDLATNDVYSSEGVALPPGLLPPALYASDSFKVNAHDISNVRSESAFTPLVIGQWDINEDTSAYASYTKGFKAGGFDPRSNTPFAFEFDEEKATAYELGFKTTTWQDRNEINVALYLTDYEDLQISQFDGAVSFNVGNAKETRVQGLEVDGRVAISNHLVASYGLSLLDFEYKDFQNGNCYFGQAGQDTNSDGIKECDYTGKSGVYTPDYTVNFGFDYRRNLNSALEFAAILDGQFVDGHQVHVNLDPAGEIDAYTMLGLRLQIGGEHWSAAILGKNLLDEAVLTYSANAPLAESTFATNTFYSFVNRPRTVALEASFKF